MSTNYINKITASNGTTYDIAEGVDTRIFTGKCTTGSGTAAKVVTLDDATNFSLVEGVKVAVYFESANISSTATLNVNSTGAKNIYFGTNIIWAAGETVIFTYDGGSEWVMTSSSGAIEYGISGATDNKVTQNYSTTSSNYPVLFSAVSGVSSTASRGDQQARLNNSMYYNPGTTTLTVNNLNIGTSINNLFQVTTAAFTASSSSIAAHGNIASADKTIPTASRVSGYNLVGIVGYQTSNYRIMPSVAYPKSNTVVRLGYANTTATAVSTAPTLTL